MNEIRFTTVYRGNLSILVTNLFVNGKTKQSQEGITQEDPLAMAMYGIAILPLIELIQKSNITQKWYADDGNVTDSLKDLKAVHKQLKRHGPAFRYTLTNCNNLDLSFRFFESFYEIRSRA